MFAETKTKKMNTIDWYWGLPENLKLDLQHNNGKFRINNNIELPENNLIFKNTIEILDGFYHVFLSKLDNKLYRSDRDAAKLYKCDIGGLIMLESCFEELV